MNALAQARPLLVAAGLAVVIGSCTFLLQRLALPRPQHDALIAASAVKILDEYRVAQAVEDVAHHHVDGSCFEGWFRDGRRKNQRGEGAVFTGGVDVVYVRGKLVVFGRRREPRRLARVELGLACPRMLGDLLAARLARRQVSIRHTAADGHAAYVVGFAIGRQSHVSYYFDAHTLTPIAIAVHGRRVSGESDLELARHDRTRLLRVLKILRTGGERHGYAYPA